MIGFALLLALVPAVGVAPHRLPADSIYGLAVDPAKYSDQQFIYLLDDGVVKYEPDGRGSKTYRQVVQILKEGAVESWAERSFGYDVDHEKLTLNWARVISSTGEVISDKPEVSQESDVPARLGDPMYTHRKVLRITLAKVAPGTLVDVSYTTEEIAPYRPGDFYTAWRVNMGLPVRRSRFVLDIPQGFSPKIKETNLTFPRQTETAGGRQRLVWAAQEVPKVESEPFAADSNGVITTIQVSGPTTWESIGPWYAGLARDRYAVTDLVKQKVASLTAGAKTLDDSLKAIHRFVARDIRYVAIELGIGGYQPRSAATVLESGVGDCKDKATLFITMLKPLRITAFPVLLNAGGEVDRGIPTIYQFDHAIAVVERPTGRTFVDLTASYEPYGSVPLSDQNQFALVVHPDGHAEEITVPSANRGESVSKVTITGTIDTAGYLSGHIEMQVGGGLASMFRSLFATDPDSAERAQLARGMTSRMYPESDGDSLIVLDKGDTGNNPHFQVRLLHGRAAQRVGNAALLSPFGQDNTDLSPIIQELERHKPRRFPIDVEAVSASVASETIFEAELPSGWTVEPSKPIESDSPFGTVTNTVTQTGKTLRIVRRQSGKKGILPPSSVDDLIAWLKQLMVMQREAGTVTLIRG